VSNYRQTPPRAHELTKYDRSDKDYKQRSPRRREKKPKESLDYRFRGRNPRLKEREDDRKEARVACKKECLNVVAVVLERNERADTKEHRIDQVKHAKGYCNGSYGQVSDTASHAATALREAITDAAAAAFGHPVAAVERNWTFG
jgi:hypothetical protein